MASCLNLCGICDFRHISKRSVVWCSECDEGLCEDCKDHHAVSKATRNHTTIPITEYERLPPYILEIEQSCSKHNEKFILFCKDHNKACCRTCALEIHKNCPNLTKIEDVIQNIKSSNAFFEVEQTIANTVENIDRIRKDRQDNLLQITKGKKQIEKEIQEIRVKINNHLDKIQDRLLNDLDTTAGNETENINQMLKTLGENEKKLKEFQTNLTNIKEHASDLQTYIALNQIEDDVSNIDQSINSMVGSESLNQKEITMNINTEILDILSKIQNFGDINVATKPSDVIVIREKDKQAQMLVLPRPPSKPIDNLSLHLTKTVKNCGDYITGCCLLPDGRMAFTNYLSGIVKVFKPDGSNDFEIKLSTYAFDIVFTQEENCLYVTSAGGTCRDSKGFHVIDISNRKIKRSIPVSSLIDGIAVRDQTLFCCVRGRGICTINPDTGSLSTVLSDNMLSDCYIATFEDNLYYAQRIKHTVTCCDLQGETKWEFIDQTILKGPLGISVDNMGNVYVAGYLSDNLVVISPDGKRCRQLLFKKDGLSIPRATQYDKVSQHLLITNHGGRSLLYKVN